jgi:hypothetical protein
MKPMKKFDDLKEVEKLLLEGASGSLKRADDSIPSGVSLRDLRAETFPGVMADAICAGLCFFAAVVVRAVVEVEAIKEEE